MIPEGAVAMLACARIGAVHSVVFGGFSPEAIHGRIEDCASDWVICADEGLRGGKVVPLKTNVDKALERVDVKAVLVIAHTGGDVAMKEGRDHWYDALSADVGDTCPCEPMNAEDPLFILYTSGSTGKPKGVLHTVGGYSVWTASTFWYGFDYRPGEIFWCSADIGWVTGHTYVVYGPLQNGATTLMFEGCPTIRVTTVSGRSSTSTGSTSSTPPHRDPGADARGRRLCDAPRPERRSACSAASASRSIPRRGAGITRLVGKGRVPVIDTWWQTETGGIMITTLPGAHPMQPGSAGRPFFGIRPQLVDAEGARARRRTDRRRVRGQSLHHAQLAGAGADDLRRSPAFRRNLFLDLQGQIFHRRRLPPRRRRITGGSPAASTM